MTIKVIYIKGYDDLTTLHPKIFVVKTNSDIKNIISVGNQKVVIWLSQKRGAVAPLALER